MTPEGSVKDRVRKILDAHKHVWYYMPVQTGYGVMGIPDYVCCIKEHFLGIECKSGNAKLTASQQSIATKIRDAGGHHITINESNMNDLAFILMHLGAVPK